MDQVKDAIITVRLAEEKYGSKLYETNAVYRELLLAAITLAAYAEQKGKK
jgi:hypothetical protein